VKILKSKFGGNVFPTAVEKSEYFVKFISIRWLIVCVALFMHFDALSLRDVKLIKYVRKLKSRSLQQSDETGNMEKRYSRGI
jgi:hypothetical protein